MSSPKKKYLRCRRSEEGDRRSRLFPGSHVDSEMFLSYNLPIDKKCTVKAFDAQYL
jgi:hypothetical protein